MFLGLKTKVGVCECLQHCSTTQFSIPRRCFLADSSVSMDMDTIEDVKTEFVCHVVWQKR